MKVLDAFNGLRRRVAPQQPPSPPTPQLDKGSRQARVVAVAAQKGGVGKTTTTVHLAVALALFHGQRVLLIDMDAQGHVGMSLRKVAHGGVRGDAHHETLSTMLLERGRDVYEVAQPTSIEGLWLVPSDCALNQTEAVMAGRIGKELLLRKALEVACTHFDTILIDCPPALGSLTVNALVAAHQVLVPCDLSVLSLDGVEGLIDTLETVRETLNPSLELLGLVRTRVDRRNQLVNQTIEQSLQRRYPHWLLEATIGVSTDLAKAQLEGQPVFLHQPRSRAAAFYRELSDEVIQRWA